MARRGWKLITLQSSWDKKVNVREKWSNEPDDFTPWLARNLDVLGRILGMKFDLIEKEEGVQTNWDSIKRVDILAEERRMDAGVVIENQLNPSDDRHLGQLLNYVATTKSDMAIWIATNFEKHSRALEWLNRNAGESTQFYGIEISVTKNANSELEPHFEVRSHPHFWDPRTHWIRQMDPLAGREQYRRFWSPLLDVLRDTHQFTGHTKPSIRPYFPFGSEFKGFKYIARFVPKSSEISVELSICHESREQNRRYFEALMESEDAIEADMEMELCWELLLYRRASRVRTTRYGYFSDDVDRLEEIRSWMIRNLIGFKEVFTPYLEDIITRRY